MPLFDLNSPELELYRGRVPRPVDFDSFWQRTLEETRAHPLAAEFEPVDVGLPLVDVFDLTFSGYGGHRVRGWFIRPRDKAMRSNACVVKFLGYNGGRGLPHEHLLWPSTGRSVLVMDTRGQGSGWAMGDTADPVGSDPAQAGHMTRGIQSPETYFYRRVFSDGVRAIEAARSHADVDPDKVAAVGGSQGGGITIAVAGLVPDLAAAMPDVPFLCDFPRAITIGPRDPYNEIVRYLAVHRGRVEQAMTTLSYFDGVNLAARAKAPALFSVALMDQTCPPSTVYAAYNAYGGPNKEIAVYRFNNHEGGGVFQDRRQMDWLKDRL